jgi:hypothetical protein
MGGGGFVGGEMKIALLKRHVRLTKNCRAGVAQSGLWKDGRRLDMSCEITEWGVNNVPSSMISKAIHSVLARV